MKKICIIAALALGATLAQAADKTEEAAADSACMVAAKEKKLSGAARTSFVTKCEREATAKCELSAADKKLSGAARTSHLKKCVRETGPAA